MLLGRNHRSGLGCGGEYGLSVQGLDGMYVNDFCGDSLFLQFLGSKEGLPYQVAGGEDRHILSFDQFQGLSYLEYLVLWSEIGYGGTAEAEINGSVVGGCRDGRCLGLIVVAGVDDGHAREHPHHADILHHLMGGTILSEGDAGVGGGYLDIGVGIADALTDLVVDAGGHEVGEGAGEGYPAAERQTGGHVYHVGLGYAALEEAVGVFLGECVHLQRAGEVSAERDHLVVCPAQLRESCTDRSPSVCPCFLYL